MDRKTDNKKGHERNAAASGPVKTRSGSALPGRKRIIPLAILVFFGVLIASSVIWAFSQFADLKMDEIIYELTAPLQGTGNGMIGSWLLRCLLPALTASAASVAVSLKSWPHRFYRYFCAAAMIGSLVLMLCFSAYFIREVGLTSYLDNYSSDSTFIEDNYADPTSTDITFPERKRNLIFIYLESMEATFTDVKDGGAFDVDYIPELTALAQENDDFSGSSDSALNGGYAMPGCTWTMGGIFATTSGLPLKTSLDDNAMASQKSFFPNLRTLGDILEEEGYNQEYLLGSDATFGGRRVYYSDHGDFEIHDYNYAIEQGLIPSDYKEFWGYEDEKLFEFAKEDLTELASGSQPFNLTLLTVDTHMPSGYKCRLCPDTYGSQYGNALACSSRQVSEFISWIQQQDFYENTTIVITGDHPTMAKGFCDDVPDSYTRKTYTCIINSAAQVSSESGRRDFTTFDLFPTTLASLGADIEGDRLGLGTNLYSDTQTLTEEYGLDTVAQELSKSSLFLAKLERPDENTEKALSRFASVEAPEITVDKDEGKISFVTPDLSEFEDSISIVRVKVWYYDNGIYIHNWAKLEKRSDGTWAGSISTKQFQNAETLSYQMIVGVDGIGRINMGEEGTISMR